LIVSFLSPELLNTSLRVVTVMIYTSLSFKFAVI